MTVAVNAAFTSAAVVPAVALNAAECKPVGIRTELGTLTELLLLPSATLVPPAGAEPIIVTVQLLVPPGPMTDGLQLRLKLDPAGG